VFFIGKVLVAQLLKSARFKCNVAICKSSCCIDGDRGAPLTEKEAEQIEKNKKKLLGLLDPAFAAFAKRNGLVLHDEEEDDVLYTNTMPNEGPCVFLLPDDGTGFRPCLIETLYKAGEIDFNKPVSCHLFPLIVRENKNNVMLTCEERYTCKGCWESGPLLVDSCREAIIRRFGEDFFERLMAAIKAEK
jgi:Fe-S-cluster containining protein